jgi:predicted nucleotidyltransferase component of viral defense system
MNKNNEYSRQVSLLVSLLPLIDEEDCFALKGGTAINLFFRPLPRLSVDIDLLYIPMDDRPIAIKNIKAALGRITERIHETFKGSKVQNTTEQQENSFRLIVEYNGVRVKIELSPVIRGTVFSPKRMEVKPEVEDAFGYAEINVASHADLYAGKICAALDRQHPRDLFDIHQLYENEGLTEDLRKTFIVFLISHQRPMNELLNPHRKVLNGVYEKEFVDMAEIDLSLDELLSARERLIFDLNSQLTEDERQFLLSFKNRAPEWSLLGLEDTDRIAELPSIKWKLINLDKMPADKHAKALAALKFVLYPSR